MENHLISNHPYMQKEFITYEHFTIGFPGSTKSKRSLTPEVDQYVKTFKEKGFYIGIFIPETSNYTKPFGHFNDDELEFLYMANNIYVARIASLIHSSNTYTIGLLSLGAGPDIRVEETVEVPL